MKTLKDGTQVHPRMWYYILDFLSDAQRDGHYIGVRASELSRTEFLELFRQATSQDEAGI